MLASIRRIFFSEAESLGKSPLPLTRQSDVSGRETLVENSRWTAGKILFSTVHVPGGSNNRRPDDPPSMADYTSRTEAAVDWIDEAFAIATRDDDDYVGVVIALHAEIFSLASIAGAFGGGGGQGGMGAQGGRGGGGTPALSMEERMRVAYGPIIDALRRGAPEMRAVEVTVEPDTPWVFSFSPFYPHDN